MNIHSNFLTPARNMVLAAVAQENLTGKRRLAPMRDTILARLQREFDMPLLDARDFLVAMMDEKLITQAYGGGRSTTIRLHEGFEHPSRAARREAARAAVEAAPAVETADVADAPVVEPVAAPAPADAPVVEASQPDAEFDYAALMAGADESVESVESVEAPVATPDESVEVVGQTVGCLMEPGENPRRVTVTWTTKKPRTPPASDEWACTALSEVLEMADRAFDLANEDGAEDEGVVAPMVDRLSSRYEEVRDRCADSTTLSQGCRSLLARARREVEMMVEYVASWPRTPIATFSSGN